MEPKLRVVEPLRDHTPARVLMGMCKERHNLVDIAIVGIDKDGYVLTCWGGPSKLRLLGAIEIMKSRMVEPD